MATVKEILDIEATREKDSATSVVNLFQEGSFLRAYEFSAWLCVKYMHDFNATKRFNKGVGKEIIFIGFPNSSLQKWIPEGGEVKSISEKHIAITLPVKYDEEQQKLFEQWKDGIQVTESSKESAKTNTPFDNVKKGDVSLTSVMSRILAFPVESKTPLDCMLFIAELKKQLSQII